jgi:hypothetical protein
LNQPSETRFETVIRFEEVRRCTADVGRAKPRYHHKLAAILKSQRLVLADVKGSPEMGVKVGAVGFNG